MKKKVYFTDESGNRFFECNPAETRLAIAEIKKLRNAKTDDDHDELIARFDRGEIGLIDVLKHLKIPYEEAPEGTVVPQYTDIICSSWDMVFENVRKYDNPEETMTCEDDPLHLRFGWVFQKANIRILLPLKN